MIVSFETASGAVFHMYHDNKSFTQEKPILRTGPLWNTPTVLLKHRVVIWTSSSDEKTVAKVIHTGVVVKREVCLA